MTYARISQDQGTQYKLPETPHASGFTFLGWYTEPDGGDRITEETLVSGMNHKLYARWERIQREQCI